MSNVKKGDKVTIEYTGKLDDGSVFDTTEGKAPFEFTVGSGDVIPGMSAGVVGMKKGETKEFTIASNDAYGSHRKELVFKIPRERVPAETKVGQFLTSQDESGQVFSLTVLELNEKEATLDANHPLAGKDLIFSVTIVNVA